MKNRILLFAVLAAAVVAIASVFFRSHPAAGKITPPQAKATISSVVILTPVETVTEKAPVVAAAEGKNFTAPENARQSATNPPAKNSAAAKEPLHDPDARAALSLVGADPAAEQYWAAAISDPSLPAQEREDLMEDLNEDGLSDPKHPGPQDLPLILNRLAIIEEIAPSADDFMLEHLGEAYKDLNNLLAGKPVQ